MQWKNAFPSLLFLFTSCLYGCAPLEIRPQKDISPNTSKNEKFRERVSDLQISLDPFFEKERLHEYFGEDLISIGILPVFVIAKDYSSNKSFLIEKGQFKVITIGQTQSDGKNSVDRLTQKNYQDRTLLNTKAKEGYSELRSGALIGSSFPILLPVALSMMNTGDQRINDAIVASENISRKEFVDRTIYPGESHQGFIYFHIKSREELDKIVAIEVKIKELRSEEYVTFMFNVKKE